MKTKHSIQKDITAWADTTFGKSTSSAIFWRAFSEFKELCEAVLIAGQTKARLLEEIADVVIVFYRLADYLGGDLNTEVKKKMAVNKKRTWVRDGNGNGRHVAARGVASPSKNTKKSKG